MSLPELAEVASLLVLIQYSLIQQQHPSDLNGCCKKHPSLQSDQTERSLHCQWLPSDLASFDEGYLIHHFMQECTVLTHILVNRMLHLQLFQIQSDAHAQPHCALSIQLSQGVEPYSECCDTFQTSTGERQTDGQDAEFSFAQKCISWQTTVLIRLIHDTAVKAYAS